MKDNTTAAKAARQYQARNIKRKAEEVYDIKELRVAGIEPRPRDLWTLSSERWRDAHRWIPISIRVIQAFCIIALLASSWTLAAVLMRDPPVLLMSYPDGAIRCAPAPLDPATRQPRARNRSERAMCAHLERKFGVGEG